MGTVRVEYLGGSCVEHGLYLVWRAASQILIEILRGGCTRSRLGLYYM